MIVLDEVLQEAEVELDLDLQVTLINLFDEPWKVRFQSGNEIFIADDGVKGISRLESDDLLISSQCQALDQEINYLSEGVWVLAEKHISIVAEQKTHACFQEDHS